MWVQSDLFSLAGQIYVRGGNRSVSLKLFQRQAVSNTFVFLFSFLESPIRAEKISSDFS